MRAFCQVGVAMVETRWPERDVELTLRTHEVPGFRRGKRGGVMPKGQTLGQSLGADAGVKLVKRGR